MNEPRFTSWRYRLGDALTSPGVGVSATGAVDLVSEDQALRQSILLLLATVPGERVMRPTYGCPLDRLVFAPNDDTTAGMAIYAVRSALERWEPRIEILALDAKRDDEDPATLLIELNYRAKASGTVDTIGIATQTGG
jgi:phage baseplate assembly protein W